MSGERVCIITGANSGIGKEAAAQIVAQGHRVIMACRSVERGETAADEIRASVPDAKLEVLQVDMGLQKSVREFAALVASRYPVIDVVIHNAAIFDVSQKQREQTSEGTETVWSVNHVGPVLLTELLLAPIEASEGGRVIMVSSKGLIAMKRLKVDLDDPEFDNRRFSVTRAYYQAKRAQVMYTFWLADRLNRRHAGGASKALVTANAIRVTAVKVDLSRHPDISRLQRLIYAMKSKTAITPQQMAGTYAWLATSEDVTGVTGRYFDEKQHEVSASAYARDRSNIEAVMQLTARYVPELQQALRLGG